MITKVMRAYREDGLGEVLWRAKRKLGLLRRMQLKYHLGDTINSLYGVKIACNFEDATFRMYVNGSYGRYYWEHLRSIRDPFVFVDIGANQGLYTLCAARNRFSVKCHSFEPNEKTYELLKKNIKINGLMGKCETHKLGISESDGKADLRLAEGHSGGASLAKGGGFGDTSISIETINHKGFDDLLDVNDLPIFVKVDVEGFEKVVLGELMKSKYAGNIAEVFYEVDERWGDPKELREILESAGFGKFEKKGAGKHYDILASR